MTIASEAVAAQVATTMLPLAGSAPGGAHPADAARFQLAMQAVGAQMSVAMGGAAIPQTAIGPLSGSVAAGDGAHPIMEALQKLNGRADSIKELTARFAAEGAEMTPSDMLQVTVRAHELLFHCELTSNVANRTSDGIQQLFRQQS